MQTSVQSESSETSATIVTTTAITITRKATTTAITPPPTITFTPIKPPGQSVSISAGQPVRQTSNPSTHGTSLTNSSSKFSLETIPVLFCFLINFGLALEITHIHVMFKV